MKKTSLFFLAVTAFHYSNSQLNCCKDSSKQSVWHISTIGSKNTISLNGSTKNDCVPASLQWPQFLKKSDGWYLDTSLSDEFNGTIVDHVKWRVFDDQTNGHNGCCSQLPSTDSFSFEKDGYLTQRANYTNTGQLYTAGMETFDTAYLYGYYEVRAKLPGYIDSMGKYSNWGFWTSAWLYTHFEDSIHCIVYHQEIDFLEIIGNQYQAADTKSFSTGIHMYENCIATSITGSLIQALPVLMNGFHNFGVMCLPDKIVYYFDGIPFKTEMGVIPWRHMKMILNNQLYNWVGTVDKTWPADYVIDYFRYYRYK